MSIIDKLIEKADEYPKKTAILSRFEQWSYKDMIRYVKMKACIIRRTLTCEKSIIGIITDESPECLMNIIAILYLGCGYVPIDNELPLERMKYIINDAGLRVLISPEKIANDLRNQTDILITENELRIDKCLLKDVPIEYKTRKEDNVMYIMYTSGSTGKPKGVLLEDGNVETFSIGINDILNFGDGDIRFLASTSFCFDISVLETLITLSYGGTCVLINKKQKMNPIFVAEFVKKNRVNVIQFTPTYLVFYMKYNHRNKEMFDDVDKILIGGERFPKNIAKKLLKITKAEIYNCYGPTETTIWATTSLYNGNEKVGIGKALRGYKVWIDEITNEICISGRGVARGYINSPALSEKVFECKENGERIYRTGDFGNIDKKGEIHFLGRKDRQVKIKGFRIELNEIEYAIEKYINVDKAAVICVDKSLIVCCYQNSKDLSSDFFIRQLRKQLPSYMIPKRYIALRQIPETINGKTDYNAVQRIVESHMQCQ